MRDGFPVRARSLNARSVRISDIARRKSLQAERTAGLDKPHRGMQTLLNGGSGPDALVAGSRHGFAGRCDAV